MAPSPTHWSSMAWPHLPRTAQRFHTTNAQVIVFQYLTGLVEHPASGEGYEAVVADWFMVWLAAMQSAVRWRRKRAATENPGPLTADSPGWLTPRAFLQKIFFELHGASSTPDDTKACRRVQLKKKLEIGGDIKEIKKLVKENASDDLVMINAPQAEFADVIVYLRAFHRFYLVQVKRTQDFTLPTVQLELGKMQHPNYERQYLQKKGRGRALANVPDLLRKICAAGEDAGVFFVLVHVNVGEESIERAAPGIQGLPADVLCVRAQGSPVGAGTSFFPVAHHVPESGTFSLPLDE